LNFFIQFLNFQLDEFRCKMAPHADAHQSHVLLPASQQRRALTKASQFVFFINSLLSVEWRQSSPHQ
jgi:hypothetical protein